MVSLVSSVDRGPDDVASNNSRGPQHMSGEELGDAANDYEEEDDTDGDGEEEVESSPSDYIVKKTWSKKAQDPGAQAPIALSFEARPR